MSEFQVIAKVIDHILVQIDATTRAEADQILDTVMREHPESDVQLCRGDIVLLSAAPIVVPPLGPPLGPPPESNFARWSRRCSPPRRSMFNGYDMTERILSFVGSAFYGILLALLVVFLCSIK